MKNAAQRPVTSAKDVGRPSIQDPPMKRINDVKTPQNKVESKPEIQNGLMKVFENNKPAINFANPKDVKREQPVSSGKDDANKQKQIKNKVSQDNLFAFKRKLIRDILLVYLIAKEIERPQRVSTPQFSNKPMNVESQQRLVGKIKAEPPVIMRVNFDSFHSHFD